MPATDLPKRKLREFLGQSIEIQKIVFGSTPQYGEYVLLITKTDSIISSGQVVRKNARDLEGNLPATVTVSEKPGKKHPYLVLE